MFCVHTTPEEFKNETIIDQFEFVFKGKLNRGNHVIIVTLSFSESSVLKTFPFTLEREANVSKFLLRSASAASKNTREFILKR